VDERAGRESAPFGAERTTRTAKERRSRRPNRRLHIGYGAASGAAGKGTPSGSHSGWRTPCARRVGRDLQLLMKISARACHEEIGRILFRGETHQARGGAPICFGRGHDRGWGLRRREQRGDSRALEDGDDGTAMRTCAVAQRTGGAASCPGRLCSRVQTAIRDHVDRERTKIFESTHRMRHRNGEWRGYLSRATRAV